MCAHLYILYRSIPTWNARASKTLVAFVEGKGLQAVLFTSNCLAFCFFAYCYTSTLSYVNLGKVYMNFLLLDLQWVRRFICFCFSLLGVSKNLHTLDWSKVCSIAVTQLMKNGNHQFWEFNSQAIGLCPLDSNLCISILQVPCWIGWSLHRHASWKIHLL